MNQPNEPHSFAQHQQGEQQINPNDYKFTAEELRVLKECNNEAFYQRSLPLAATLGAGAFFGVKTGFIRGSAKYGPAPKVVLGVIVGYFVGKLSYQQACAEKLMKLPNSKLAEMLRQRRKGGFVESLTPDQGFGSGLSMGPFGSQTEVYSDETYKKSSVLDMDPYQPTYSDLDNTSRPHAEKQTLDEDLQLPLEPPKTSVSYDELRRQNREEYVRKQQSPYRAPPVSQEQPPPVTRAPERPIDNTDGLPPRAKNRYGDTWA